MKLMTDAAIEKKGLGFLSLFRGFAVQRDHALPQASTWLVYLATLIITFNYFEVQHNYWFLRLINGYVIKEWFPPFVLLLTVFIFAAKSKIRMIPLGGIGLLIASLILYVFFGSLALIKNEQLYFIGKHGLIMFGPLILYAAIVIVFTDNISIEKLLTALFWAGVALSLFVFYMYDVVGIKVWNNKPFVFKFMWTNKILEMPLSVNYSKIGDYYSHTKSLLFINDSFFAASLAPLIIFGFLQSIKALKAVDYLYYLPSFFLFYTLLNTASRSAFISFSIGLLLFLWLVRKKILHIVLILTVLIALTMNSEVMHFRLMQLGGMLTQKISIVLPDKLNQIIKPIVTAIDQKVHIQKEAHIESVPITFDYIKKSPFFGRGISFIANIYGESKELNRYLYIALTAGILTAVPYISHIFLLAIYSFKSLRALFKTRQEHFSIGLVLFPSVLIFAIQINNCGMETYYYWVFFGLAAAWVRNCYYERENEYPAH